MKKLFVLSILSFMPLLSMETKQTEAKKKKLLIKPILKLSEQKCCSLFYDRGENEINFVYFENPSLPTRTEISSSVYDLSRDEIDRKLDKVEHLGLVASFKPIAVVLAKKAAHRDSCLLIQDGMDCLRLFGLQINKTPAHIENITFHKMPERNIRITLLAKVAQQIAKIRFLIDDNLKKLTEPAIVKSYGSESIANLRLEYDPITNSAQPLQP